MRKLISILSPVYWTTAQEAGEAVNGYTLTGGVFRRETQVEFATGMEVLVQLDARHCWEQFHIQVIKSTSCAL